MKRLTWLLFLLLAASCSPYDSVGSSTYFGFSIGVSSAPPPPSVVLVQRPDLVVVPGTSVYVVENGDYDMFQYGTSIYLASGGYWYRGSNYTGPFEVCDVRRVPREVLTVPSNRWKHRPPGQVGRWERRRDRDRDHDRDHDRDRDRD